MDLTPTVIWLSIFAIIGTILLPFIGIGITIFRAGSPPDSEGGSDA